MKTDTAPSDGLATRQTQTALANIKRWNPIVNAMITVTRDEALQTAAELDHAAEQGEWLGLLHGMTICLKDRVDMKGVRTTGASKILENNVADADAFIVQRLRRNGAVIVGKANLHEFCFGPTSQSTLRPRAQSLGRGWHRWRIQRRIGGGSGIGHVHGIHRK